MARRRTRTATPFRPMRPIARIGHRTLATSVSALSLLAAGALSVAPARAQTEGTLPDTQILQGGRWTGARMPTVAQGNGGLVMTIKQEQERALLDWAKFNIAAGDEVVFDQQQASWIVLNRIFDSKPSEIAGRITAKGQVWLSNTNGILFKGTSQVNTHSILATSSQMPDSTVFTGLLAPRPTASWGDIGGLLIGAKGDIVLEKGARLTLKSSDPAINSKAILLGVNVVNNGTIDVTDGQVLMMAGEQFILNGYSETFSYPYLRGLWGWSSTNYPTYGRYPDYPRYDKFMSDRAAEIGMQVINNGTISSTRGNIFLQGADVLQNGTLLSTTGVRERSGSIVLRAAYGFDDAEMIYSGQFDHLAGNVVFGTNSLTQITPEAGDDASPALENFTGSQITVAARDIVMDKGSTIRATAGTVSIFANMTQWSAAVPGGDFQGSDSGQPGTFTMRDGALIDVSGLKGVAFDVGDNIVDLEIRANELSASPNQRDGILYGEKVKIDIRQGSEIVDWTGTLANRSLTAEQRSVDAGKVEIRTLRSVRMENGSRIDLSGGTADYAGGLVDYTVLIGADGVFHDIADANATVLYTGLGTMQRHEAGYSEGGDAGRLEILSPSQVLFGRVKSDVFNGVHQIAAGAAGFTPATPAGSTSVVPTTRLARGGEVLIGTASESLNEYFFDQVFITAGQGALTLDVSGGTVTLDPTKLDASGYLAGGYTQSMPSGTSLLDPKYRLAPGWVMVDGKPAELRAALVARGFTGDALEAMLLPSAVLPAGFLRGEARRFSFIEDDFAKGAQFIAFADKSDAYAHSWNVQSGVNLSVTAGGTLSLYGTPADIGSNVTLTAPGGTLALLAARIGGGSKLSVAGQWVNDSDMPGTYGGYVDGGTISLLGAQIDGDVTIDASGGGWWKRLTPPDAAHSLGTFELVNGEGGDIAVSRNALQSGAELLERLDFQLGGLGGFGSLSLQDLGDIVIGPDGGSAPAGAVYLSDTTLNGWGVGSLAISGGIFQQPVGAGLVGRIAFTAVTNPNQPNSTAPDFYLAIAGQVVTAEVLARIEAANATAAAFNATRPTGTTARRINTDVFVSATVDVVAGTRLDLKRQTWALDVPQGAIPAAILSGIASGADLSQFVTTTLLPDHLRGPVTFALVSTGKLTTAADSVIRVDAGGSIAIGGRNIDLAGDLVAHGGGIAILNPEGVSGAAALAARTLIRSTALLDASGIAQTRLVEGTGSGHNWIDGRVLAGGTITLTAANEMIVDAGALLDVSGAKGTLTVSMPGRFAIVRTNRVLGSDAGEIDISAGTGYMLGDIRGEGGTPDARAGMITLSGGLPGKLFEAGYGNYDGYGLQLVLDTLSSRLLTATSSTASNSLNATGGTVTKNISVNNLRDWWAAPAQAALRTATGLQAADIEPIPFVRTGATVTVAGAGGGTFKRVTAADIANVLSLFEQSFAKMVSSDVSGRFYVDPTLAALPMGQTVDGPLPGGPIAPVFTVPTGYTPITSSQGFLNAMAALRQTNASTTNPSSNVLNGLRASADFTVGKGVFDKLSTFDSVTLGAISLKGDLTIEAKGTLNLSGAISTNGADLTLRAPQIQFGNAVRGDGLGGATGNGADLPLTDAVMTAVARDIHVVGVNFFGFGTVNLTATHALAGGGKSALDSHIYSAGDLNITAGQIYPYTGSQFILLSDKSITIKGTGQGGASPLSAAGRLIIAAPTINQGGVVAAPFGEIRFDGADINFLKGSLTTVSAGDRTILYGYTLDGSSWYGPNPDDELPQLLGTPPEKRITITGDNVDLQLGATIDASGGGDVLGLEFVQGPMGSANILTGAGVFAISTALGTDVSLGTAPSSADRKDYAVGDTVWLPAFDGNPAGYYTLLPAEYALTPGGYRVTVVPGGDGGTTAPRTIADGTMMIAGYQAGEQGQAFTAQNYTTFSLLSGGEVRRRSEFIETSGNLFFSSERFLTGLERSGGVFNADPRLPIDGGFMTIAARNSLQLNGTFEATGANASSRGGLLDIASDYIVIASATTDISDLGAGYLRLDPTQLSGVAESLLIGGVRRQGLGGLEIVTGYEGQVEGGGPLGSTVGAARIVVRNGANDALTGPEILFTATDQILFETGSVVRAIGDGFQAPDVLIRAELPQATVLVDGWNPVTYAAEDRGAFVRISNLGDVSILRTAPQTDRGDVIVETGVRLEATDAVALNATRNTTLAPGAVIKAGAIEAAAGSVSFGNAPAASNGLVLTQTLFDALAGAGTLRLRSLTNFSLYGDVTLTTANDLVLDGGGILDVDGAGASSFKAKTLTLTNTQGAVDTAVANTARLSIAADTLNRAGGSMGLSFGTVDMDVKGRMLFSGTGATNTPGDVTIRATQVTATGGAAQDLVATGAVALLSQAQPATLAAIETAGASIDLVGRSVRIDLPVALNSGVLRATAIDDVTIGGNGRLDVSGSVIQFFDKTEYLTAGAIGLSSETGDVIVDAGAVLDVSGGAGGGDAGALVLSASRGVALLNGTLRSQSAAAFRGGEFTLRTSTLADFGTLNATLNDSGFSRLRRFSIADGNAVLDGITRVEQFELSTGSGSVTVASGAQILTTGDKGGKILIASGGDLVVNAGALLDASANGTDQRGGTVSLQVGDNGTLTVSAARIDVSATGTGQAGEVHLRARQTGNDVAVASYQPIVAGGITRLEAYRVTDLGSGNGIIDTALQVQVTDQAAAFIAASAAGIRSRLAQADSAKFVISPGIEIRAGGDLTLVDNWNLRTDRYDGAAGVLTLRAGGDLNINANISDGFVDGVRTQEVYAPIALNVPVLPDTLPVVPNKLTNDQSWSYNLVAGANFSQTNVLSTLVSASGAGDVNLDGMVRTGTGDITVAASGDLIYAQPDTWTLARTDDDSSFREMTLTGPDGTTFSFTAKYDINSNYTYEVDVPGLGKAWFRPGDGQLTLADGRNIRFGAEVQFLVNNASIYTAGVAAAAVADFDTPIGFDSNIGTGRPEAYYFNTNYTRGGGDVTVSVGGSVLGVDDPHTSYDWSWWRGSIVPGGQLDSVNYADPRQPFAAGFFGLLDQTSSGILFDAFRQSIGALGGGDVTITAGGDVTNVSVALPTSVRVSGGRTVGVTKTAHIDGGGDLQVDAGGAIDNSWFYVSKGVSDIRADGAIGTGPGSVAFVIDDAQLNVQAGGDIRIGNIRSGAVSDRGTAYRPQASWHGYTENSSAQFLSLGGDVTFRGLQPDDYRSSVLPSILRMVAPNGSINFGEAAAPLGQTVIDQFPAGHVEVLARNDINFHMRQVGQGYYNFIIGWDSPNAVGRLLNPVAPNCCFVGEFFPGGIYQPGGAGYSTDGTPNVRAGRSEFSAFYALEGDIVSIWSSTDLRDGANPFNAGTFLLGHETRIRAGDDIRLGALSFYNQDADDVSMVQANGSIYLPDISAYGAGRMWVEAGDEIYMGSTPGRGIRAIEYTDTDILTNVLNGVDLTVLAGIDQRPEYEAFLGYYLGTGTTGTTPSYLQEYFTFDARNLGTPHTTLLADGSKATIYAVDLVSYWNEMNGRAPIELEGSDGRQVARGTLVAAISKADFDAALAWFQALDPVKQQPLATSILFAEIKVGGREAVGSSVATDPAFTRNGDPTRGYAAIGKLFPGAQRKPGEALQAGEARWFGDLIMTDSQIRTDGGGDAEILVPGGMVQLASLGVTNTSPGSSGVLTQDRGSVYALTYGDYIVNQSRTMTADDGDILIWSSFGNIDAGKGRKTSLSIPPIRFPMDINAITTVVRSGLPNGAGIATLDRIDGTPGGDVDLYAFNGIVNAGDAGIRASRDLFIGAIEIRGLDNITVGGVTNVDLGNESGEVGALNLENFARTAEDDALKDAFNFADQVEKMRTVRQTILTGSVVSFGIEGDEEEDEEEKKRKK
jgi:filamentous hemagglutinin family protein